MNIDSLTFGELKQIAAMFQAANAAPQPTSTLTGMIGLKCIIRTYSAGVWFAGHSQH